MSAQDQNNLSIVSPSQQGSNKYAIMTIIVLIVVALLVFRVIKINI